MALATHFSQLLDFKEKKKKYGAHHVPATNRHRKKAAENFQWVVRPGAATSMQVFGGIWRKDGYLDPREDSRELSTCQAWFATPFTCKLNNDQFSILCLGQKRHTTAS
eukprot:1161868-Pelagomonas_calceolata.AAC.2